MTALHIETLTRDFGSGDGISAAGQLDGPTVVLVSTLDASALGEIERSGARGFVPKSELASPRLVELLGPP